MVLNLSFRPRVYILCLGRLDPWEPKANYMQIFLPSSKMFMYEIKKMLQD